MTSFWKNERAISEVVGALLIIAIIISATSIFLSQQVPEWTKEFEYQHASKVPQDFAELGAHIDMAVASEDPATSLSTAIGTTPGSVPLVGLQASGGTLTFDPDKETFECVASTLEPTNISEDRYWNDTSSWENFTEYHHVKVTDSGARLASEAGEDKEITHNETLSGIYKYDRFIVRNNSILTVPGRLTIYATYIALEAGSQITADGMGWRGGLGNNPGSGGDGEGGGKGGKAEEKKENTGGAGGGGGGGGGKGGDGGNNSNSGGSPAVPLIDYMGSGGGGGGDWKETGNPTLSTGGDGGSGGGFLRFDASVIDIQGAISANGSAGEGNEAYPGQSYQGGGGGGGSGGWISIAGDSVDITGSIYAVGGNGGSSDKGSGGGGGGGGVINVTYDSEIKPGEVIINDSYLTVSNGTGGMNNRSDTYEGKPGEPGKKKVGYWLYIPSIFYYSTGYLVSTAYNTNSTLICYGNLTYGADLLHDTGIVVKVRTSMYSDMRDAVPWEDCPPVVNGQDISDLPIVSDGHRYIQWRAELFTFDPRITPLLSWVNISYEYGKRPVLVTSSGQVTFASQYLYYTNYQLIYTTGGTIREQYDGDFMLFAPPLFVGTDGSGISLQITSINLTGGRRTLSGRLRATVEASYQDDTLLTNGLNFENISLNITTSYPNAWEQWFNAICEEAGITPGTDPGEYNITTAPDALQVIFYGNETRPVNLWLKRSSAEVGLQS